MELTAKQLKIAETKLRPFLPKAQRVLGSMRLKSAKISADPVKILVDKWPDFSVVICDPHYEQGDDSYKETIVYAREEAGLEATIRNSNFFDWTKYFCVDTSLRYRGVFKAVAAEKQIPSRITAVCRIMTLKDLSRLPSINSSGISLGSLNESHIDLINQTWKFSQGDMTVRMIQNMTTNFPSCCVLDAKGKPVSWALTSPSCAMGMLYTLPEHRGKGYARVVTHALAKKLHVQGFPAYALIEETNAASYKLFSSLGFKEVPSYREATMDFNFDSTFDST